ADRKLAQLKDRAARATTARNAKEHELHKTVIVTLDGAAASAGAKLVLEYHVPGPRWAPGYALYLGRGASSAELLVRAAVAHRTGEDWKEARLVRSTADPEKWTELPELKSIRIGRAQPRKRPRGWREPPVGAYELYADYDRAFGAPRNMFGTPAGRF